MSTPQRRRKYVKKSQIPCKYHAQGKKCPHGNSCRFLHQTTALGALNKHTYNRHVVQTICMKELGALARMIHATPVNQYQGKFDHLTYMTIIEFVCINSDWRYKHGLLKWSTTLMANMADPGNQYAVETMHNADGSRTLFFPHRHGEPKESAYTNIPAPVVPDPVRSRTASPSAEPPKKRRRVVFPPKATRKTKKKKGKQTKGGSSKKKAVKPNKPRKRVSFFDKKKTDKPTNKPTERQTNKTRDYTCTDLLAEDALFDIRPLVHDKEDSIEIDLELEAFSSSDEDREHKSDDEDVIGFDQIGPNRKL